MKKKFNIKIFIIIVLTILVFLYLIVFNVKKNTKVEVTAEISLVGTNYVIATDEENNDYLLNTSEPYNIGDKIKVVLKNVKKGNPYTGEIIKIDTISKKIIFSTSEEDENITNEENIKDNNDNPNQENSNNIEDNNLQNSNNNEITNNDIDDVSSIVTDDQVITYLNNFSNEIDENSNLKETIKEKFVMVVDFLFYDGTIGEKTFDELSTSTKLKVLEITLTIDQKIENKFPGYKESISTNSSKIYTNLKTRALELYLDITTSVCEDNETLCSDAKIGLGELKRSFSLTWDFIKEISGIGLEKLKSWYEVWKEV